MTGLEIVYIALAAMNIMGGILLHGTEVKVNGWTNILWVVLNLAFLYFCGMFH